MTADQRFRMVAVPEIMLSRVISFLLPGDLTQHHSSPGLALKWLPQLGSLPWFLTQDFRLTRPSTSHLAMESLYSSHPSPGGRHHPRPDWIILLWASCARKEGVFYWNPKTLFLFGFYGPPVLALTSVSMIRPMRKEVTDTPKMRSSLRFFFRNTWGYMSTSAVTRLSTHTNWMKGPENWR